MMKTCRECQEAKPSTEFYAEKRNTSDLLDSYCKSCRNRRLYAWRERNRDSLNVYERDYYASLPVEQKQKWLATRSRYRAAKPHVGRSKAATRRSRIAGNGILAVSEKDWRRLLSRPCSVCGERDGATVDHIIPIARGGRHSIGNLQMLCRSHNSSKGALLGIEFRARLLGKAA
jgi:5-methylcytosine-specific restriction endonuclease McrA